jgi:hypothetical protein
MIARSANGVIDVNLYPGFNNVTGNNAELYALLVNTLTEAPNATPEPTMVGSVGAGIAAYRGTSPETSGKVGSSGVLIEVTSRHINVIPSPRLNPPKRVGVCRTNVPSSMLGSRWTTTIIAPAARDSSAAIRLARGTTDG